MARNRIRIVVVDDHAIVRDGVRFLLQAQPDMEVAGEAADSRSALAVVAECSPDVVLLDVQLPDRNGLETAIEILKDKPATRVILLSGLLNPLDIHHALRTGISGYISKVSASTGIIDAVRAVMQGKRYLCPEMITAMFLEKSEPSKDHPPSSLSEREKCLLRLVADGKRNKEIAEALHVTPKSAETYRSRLMAKLACPSTAQLVRYAIREKIVAA